MMNQTEDFYAKAETAILAFQDFISNSMTVNIPLKQIREQEEQLGTYIVQNLFRAVFEMIEDRLDKQTSSSLDKITSSGNKLLKLNNKLLIAYGSSAVIDTLEKAILQLVNDPGLQEMVKVYRLNFKALQDHKLNEEKSFKKDVGDLKERIYAGEELRPIGICKLCPEKPGIHVSFKFLRQLVDRLKSKPGK